MGGLRELALELLKGEGFEVIELLEDLGHRRGGVWIYTELFPLIIWLPTGFLRPEEEKPAREPEEQCTYNSDGKPGHGGNFHLF
jgi:hypothetical protein